MRKVNKNKILEGLEELMQDRLNILEKELGRFIQESKKDFLESKNEDELTYKKSESKRFVVDLGNSIYEPSANVAKSYIDIKDYNKDFQNFMNAKIKEIDDYSLF